MFPTCHSVTGERTYLSPLAAVWDAWKLRGEVISHSFDDCHDYTSRHPKVFQSQTASVRSVLRISQEPQNVRRLKRVHFDDCIEVAMCMDTECRLYSTFVKLDALYEWSDKPWYYFPTPPSRRFSWRKLTDLKYPFCIFEEKHSSADSSNVVSASLLRCHRSNSTNSAEEGVCTDSGSFDVLSDITNTCSNARKSLQSLLDAPMSLSSVLSTQKRCGSQQLVRLIKPDFISMDLNQDKENQDVMSAVQIGQPSPHNFKNSPMDLQQAFQMQAFHEGHVQHEDGNDEIFGEGVEDSDGYSPGDTSGPSDGQSPIPAGDRQDVILYHLDDNPIRAFINWNSYEEMITEMAHHYGLRREDVEDAYEVTVSPPDIGNEVVPTIVHAFGDIPPESTDRLVLIDIEYHAHRIEHNFRSGPQVQRCVRSIPLTASRNEVLYRVNVDRYCRSEGGRCLVFINSRRWPDYDLDRKVIAHGDYIRIALPPSERFACPTVEITHMTQHGFTDQQILDEIYNDDAASGFSPSLLGEEDVRGLARDRLVEADEATMMQTHPLEGSDAEHPDEARLSQSSDSDNAVQDWFVDLQRIVEVYFQQCDEALQNDFMFSVYTWFIDQETSKLCREPKIAILGDDPLEWKDDLMLLWQYHLVPGNSVLIDLVQPFAQRSRLEEHIAHIILTQRPVNLNSVLFSMEFVDEVQPNVVVTFAAAVPHVCSARDLADHIPLFDAFFLNNRNWVYPEVNNDEQTIATKFGLGIKVQIFADARDDAEEMSDNSILVQKFSSALSANGGSSSSGMEGQDDHGGLKTIGKDCQVPIFVNFSLTEEFIRYIQAVGAQAVPADVPPILPEGMSEQPTWVQDLWEKWVETIAQNGADPQSGPRLETWFTNPRRWTRCDHSRVVVLSTNFHQWERELLNVWYDRAEQALPTQFAIVFPTPDDIDRTVQEQIVIEQQSEPFSRTVVVTVCDTHRSNGRHGSIALVVSDQLHIRSLITLLGYAEVCPPEREDNECLLWMGNIAIRPDQTLHVRTGNALRFLVRRGIRVSIPELLSMSDLQFRQELRAAIGGAVFRRPNVVGFPADPHSANNPVSASNPASSRDDEHPPDWFNQLQEVFDRSAFVEHSEEGPVLYVLVWFVQGSHIHTNDNPRVVRIDADSQWWRSELIFPWRDQVARAEPIDLHFVDPMPPSHPWQSHAAHIIITQALPEEHVGVLATVVVHGNPNCPVSQTALIVHSFSGVRDFVNRVGNLGSSGSVVRVRRGRLAFPPEHTVRVGSGDGIVIEVPPTAPSSDVASDTQMISFQADSDALEHPGSYEETLGSTEVVHDEDEGDSTLLLQCLKMVESNIDSCDSDGDVGKGSDQQATLRNHEASDVASTSHVDVSKSSDSSVKWISDTCPDLDASYLFRKIAAANEDALGIGADSQQENDLFAFNPNAREFQPQGAALPEWAQVLEDIYHVWDVHAATWQGESRSAHFMTWYLAPNTGQMQCLYGRKIVFFVDFWNWREQLRRKWVDVIDPGVDFQLVLVSPSPTQMEAGISGHIIIIQHNSPEWSPFILSTFDPAVNGGHPFHMALSFHEQLLFQEVLDRVGYTIECMYHAQCAFRLRSQMFGLVDRVRVSDGDAIDLIVNRQFVPQNWNPPFIPHAPGAEGLALLQKQAKVIRHRNTDDLETFDIHGSQPRTISIHDALGSDDEDVEGMPFTLAVLINQQQAQQKDLAICVWEMHDGSDHFEMHPRGRFDAGKVSQSFREKHNLIQKCSELYCVNFTRKSWHFTPNCWYIGSTTPVMTGKALVACVIYHKGCASVRVLTLPQNVRTDLLRDVLNIVHGTFVRVNGVIQGVVVALRNGDVLEYHSAEFKAGFLLDKSSTKVQICLDATITSHRPVFDDDGDAFEVLPFPNVRQSLSHGDDWSFCMIPEGTDLHKETFEALHLQQEVYEGSILAHELYVDGATCGDWSAWAVIAVAVTEKGRFFKGCLGDVTETERHSPKWIGAIGHSNVDAELSAMAVASAFASFGSADTYFVIRPDLALSKRFLDIDSTSRQASTLARVVHVLGQSKPDNVQVTEVRAHCGDPWNEIADAVAKWVAKRKIAVGSTDWKILHQIAETPSTQKWEWLRWQNAAFAKTMPKLHGDAVWQPTASSKKIGASVASLQQCPNTKQFSLSVATYKGLALDENEVSSVTTGARSLRLDSQFHGRQIAVIGIQESRTAAGIRCTDHYKIFSSGYQQCGRSKHFGCELWVNKFLPIARKDDGSPIRLCDCKVTILSADPRLLVAQLEGPIQIRLIVAHAPCVSAERPFEQVKNWWHELTGKIAIMREMNVVMLIDANAPLAEHETLFFGMHHHEDMNPQGYEFQEFLIANELYVPSTFAGHVGPSATWHHPRGGQLRRDYVLLSKSMYTMCVKSQIWRDFDGGFGHLDHCPAICHLEGVLLFQSQLRKLKWDYDKLHDPAAQKEFAEALKTLPLPSWEVSVDDHSTILESNILQLATQHFGSSKRERVRPTLSGSTIAGIQLKRQALDMARSQGFQDESLVAELKCLEKVVRSMVLADQKKWYADWLDSINDDWAQHDVALVYKKLQRLGRRKKDLSKGPRPLPRLKTSEQGFATTFEECQQVWKKQFAVIEAGIDATELQLAQLHEGGHFDARPDPISCPDPCQILALIRKFKNGKVPGPGLLPVDVIKSGGYEMAQILTPLLTKAVWHMREPLSWKGGLLVPLFKGKGSPAVPSAYRSIFLSDICAKIHHGDVRQRLAEVWNKDASLIQLGGRKGCSTDVAHHLLHAHLAWARAANISCAILFVDLQSAFYSVLRSSFFQGEFHDDAICYAMKQLGITPDEWQEIRSAVASDDATKGLGPHQVGILKDMFSATHFSMQGLEGRTATMRGTRPGDPVADILFNMVFRLVVLDARTKIEASTQMSCFGSPKQAVDVSEQSPVPERGFAEVTFVDDIAYALHSASPDDVISSLQLVASRLHDSAASRGLTINYSVGKTEALIKLAGPGSRSTRHKMWHTHGGKLPIVTEHGVHSLQLVHSYKHLGSYMQDHAVVQKDICYRTAQARKAFGQLHRQFYGKRNVHDRTKSVVFAALVMSRHTYNAHTWAWVTEKDIAHWENGIRSQVAALAKNTLRSVPSFHFSTSEICALIGLNGPKELLHANRLRYVKRAIQSAPAALWALLHANNHENSWLVWLKNSFCWLREHLPRTVLPEFCDVGEMLTFIAIDEKWKGKVKAALKSCLRVTAANAEGKLWTYRMQTRVSQFAKLPDIRPPADEGQWKCNLCAASFGSKKALAVHARHKHQYRTMLKYYVLGDECLACGKKFFSRVRLLAHVGASQTCKDAYYACFVPAAEEVVEKIEDDEREQARALRAQGWKASKAFLPVTRISGPLLPGSGTEGAASMKARWSVRVSETGRAFYGLDGYCEQPLEPSNQGAEILPFLLQTNGGKVSGEARIYEQFGLAAEAAKLHITCFIFVHFFSGYRRKGDLQHCIESHEIVGTQQIFCISVDLCLAKQFSDLTDADTKEFWIKKMRQGQILGVGGGPSCETWSAARHMPDGPSPLRSYDSPWGIAGLTRKQWDQVYTGTKLIQFLIDLLVIASQLGLCGFFEHPQFPVWLMKIRPASVWTLQAMRTLARLECVQICSFDQCVYGLDATKPTTLLLLRLSTFKDVTFTRGLRGRCPHRHQHVPLQGIRQDGSFSTARAKVYPEAMNRAIAVAISWFLTERQLSSSLSMLPMDLQQLNSTEFTDESIVQPDYHR